MFHNYDCLEFTTSSFNTTLTLNQDTKLKNKTKERRSLLLKLYADQKGLCAYCGKKTWAPYLDKNKKWKLNGVGPKGESRQFRATLEHLIKQEHNGSDEWINCVLACNRCNSQRGDIDAMEYFLLFQKQKDYPSIVLKNRQESKS